MVAQAPIVANEVKNPVFISNNVLSAISDSGIYITGLGNHSVTCILLDTGATVSVLNEETWRKSGHVSQVNPVTGTLTTANGNELTVVGETKVRFHVETLIVFGQSWLHGAYPMIAYLARFFSSTLAVKFTMTLEPL